MKPGHSAHTQGEFDNNNSPVYTIGVAAEIVGVSVHTLRLYERDGLIVPARTDTQRRLYTRNDIDKFLYLRNLHDKYGLNVSGMKVILSLIPCWDIINCSTEDRSGCDAYNQMISPCWSVLRKGMICRDMDCRDCQVYQEGLPFQNMKSFLLQHHHKTASARRSKFKTGEQK